MFEAVFIALLFLGRFRPIEPFSSRAFALRTIPKEDPSFETSQPRRLILSLVPTAVMLSIRTPPQALAVMDSDQKVFSVGKNLGIPESKERFQEARKSLLYLIDNYDQIVKEGGGDNVRRYLGTVGTGSALYGIPKVLKELQSEANDIVEYTETMSDFDYYLRAADTAAYSALFVEHSSAKTTPQQFFADAQKAALNMKVCMDRMAAELDIKVQQT